MLGRLLIGSTGVVFLPSLEFESSRYSMTHLQSLYVSLYRYDYFTMLSSYNFRKLLSFILVCLLGFTFNPSARSDDSQVQFDSAFGLFGQTWSDIKDLYTRDGKIYILSSDGVYAKDGQEWKERKFAPDVTNRFGKPTQLVVDRNGSVFVVFKESQSGTSSLTLTEFSKNLKLRSARGIGYGNCEEFERYSNRSLAAVVYELGTPLVITITGTTISTEVIPKQLGDSGKRLIRIKLSKGHRYVSYSDDITHSFVEIMNKTLRPIVDVVINPDTNQGMGNWVIDNDVLIYIGGDAIHTVDNGIDTSVPYKGHYPDWEGIERLSTDELILSNSYGHLGIIDQNGVVKEEFGGYGQHVLDIYEGYGGLLVDEDTVWLPGVLGIKVLGDNRTTINVVDTLGGATWTQCITRYDEQSVAVGYSSISGQEYGIAIIDISTHKTEKRLLVKLDYGIYQQVAVCNDGSSKKVVAIDAYGNLVSDDWTLDYVVPSVVAYGDFIYARFADSEGISKLNRNGMLVEANVLPWIRGNHFAILSGGKSTDGLNVYDATGLIIAKLDKYPLSISTFGDDKFLLQVNSNTTSVVYRY